MIRLGWSRNHINRQILRVRSAFRWAAAHELLPVGVYDVLRTVEGLRAARSAARESALVRPVAESHAAAIFAHLPSQVRAMVELEALTGMRPGGAHVMRGCDIDTTGKPWKYRPASHKTAHHGHDRVPVTGPQARAVLGPFLEGRDPLAHVPAATIVLGLRSLGAWTGTTSACIIVLAKDRAVMFEFGQ
jgi:hypothetical protein